MKPWVGAKYTLGAPAGSASAPADVVGPTGIQWTNDPNASAPPTIAGNNATLTNPTAVVGQQIVLTGLPTAAQLEDLPLSITDPTPPTWTVGGTNIGGYNPLIGGSSVTETTLTGATLTTYWIYPGTYPVTYTSCMESQTTTPALNECTTVTATFEVSGGGTMSSAPQKQLSTNSLITCQNGAPPTGSGPFPTLWWVNYGSVTGYSCVLNPGGSYGMVFTPSGAPSAGTYSYLQLINTYQTSSADGPILTGICNYSQGIDRLYPYPGIIPYTSPPQAEDAPGDSLEPGYVETISFNATMFLLWTSNLPNSITVPIGYQNWGFSGGASQDTSGTWQAITNLTPPNNTPPGPTAAYTPSAASQTTDGNTALKYGYPIWSDPATCK